MADDLVSIDEFLSARKDFVKSGDILMKASRAASSWDKEKRSIRFVMSAEIEDRDNDIVYQDGLKTEEFLKNPAAFFNHRSYNFPVGTWSDLAKVNGRPKRTEGTLTLVPEGVEETADQLAKHLAAGSIKACSIGFRPKAIKKRAIPEDKKDSPYYWPGYDILEAELLECSPCTIPANPAALAKMAETGDAVLAKELIEQVLDEWAKDPATGLLVPREVYEQAHKDITGGRTMKTIIVSHPSFKSPLTITVDDDGNLDVLIEKTADGQKPDPGTEQPPAPETPPAGDPETAPEPTPEQKDGLLTRLWKLLGGTTDEEIERRLAEQRRIDVERTVAEAEAKAAAARDREALEQRFQNLETRLGEKGLV